MKKLTEHIQKNYPARVDAFKASANAGVKKVSIRVYLYV